MSRIPRFLSAFVLLVSLGACQDDPAPANQAGASGAGGSGGTGGSAGSGATGGSGGSVADACAGVEAARATCQDLPERFDTSTTVEKGCYRVAKTPVLADGVTLTLAAGVMLIFDQETALNVYENRALVAAGTAEEPICLTGNVAERGAWQGLVFGRTEGDDDKLDHVTIEYAGSTLHDADGAAVKLNSDSRAVRLSITNTTIRESQGFGLYLIGSTEMSAFENNTITKNTLGPVSADSNAVGLLDSASSYGGNDVDEIDVRANALNKNITWHSLGIPYHIDSNFNVQGPWVLEAPNTVIMSEGTWISINGDDAGLSAVGTADKPILFTGAVKERGSWERIDFDTTNNEINRLEFVTVEYGGSTKHDANGAGVRATADSHGVTLSLSNTTIRESEGFGLFLTGSAITPSFTTNVFTANTLGPVTVGSQAAHLLDTTSLYTGNGVDHIRVRDNQVGKTVTWQAVGVPYELEGSINVYEVWTLAAGVTLLMPEAAWIHIGGDDAGFHVVGTAEQPITITGMQKTNGYWDSIVYDTTLNGANVIAFATIEYGGAVGGGGEVGMIQAQSDSHGVSLSVTDSTIRGSEQYGIYLGMWAQSNADIETSNTFADNTLGDVLKE